MNDDDDLLEGRVRAAFLSERRRAEADVEAGALATRRNSRQARRSARALAGLATLAIVAVLAVATVATFSLMRYGPVTSSASPTSPPTASPPPRVTSPADRYNDGIPRTFQGQAVLRWDEALARRQTATTDTPFLVGVWLEIPLGPHFCPADPGPDPSAPDSWISRGGCQFNYVSGDAGAPASRQNGVTTFRFYEGVLATGPAIMRVHVRDSRADQCGPQKATCFDMIVVDDILWTGDAYTDPQPFSRADVVAAVRSVDPATELVAEDGSNVGYSGGGVIDSMGLVPASAAKTRPADMQIAGVFLMRSVEAMKRALPDVQPGPAGALQSPAWRGSQSGSGPDYSYSIQQRWLIVDNVAFSVRTASPPTAGDKAWLARLEAALRATH